MTAPPRHHLVLIDGVIMRQCGGGHPPRLGGICKPCTLQSKKRWRKGNPEKVRQYRKTQRDRARLAAFAHYGGQCTCCGENDEAFLVMDHVDGGGAAHRRSTSAGRHIGIWLKRNGYPPGFQVLCANCNMAKERPEGCPHQRKATRQ